MFGGIEFDLLPAVASDGCRGAVQRTHKPEKAWLAGELIVRAERQGLTRLPIALWRKTTLQQLVLTGNALAALPPDIGALRQLRRLLLGSNRLSAVPEELCELVCLERLDLQENLLETVPRRLARLVRLQVLNLNGNPLSGRLAERGPTVGEVWDERPSDSAAADAASSSSTEAVRLGDGNAGIAPAVEDGGGQQWGANGGAAGEQTQQPADRSMETAAAETLPPETGEGVATVTAEGKGGAAAAEAADIEGDVRESPVPPEATPGEGPALAAGRDSAAAAAAAAAGADAAGEARQVAADQPLAASLATPGTPAVRPSAAAAAAALGPAAGESRGGSDGGLARRTQRFMRYMLALQEPAEALAIKQAKLALLQQAARARVEGLACTADLEELAGCQMVVREAALGPDLGARVDAAVAATTRLRAASEAGDRLELSKALRAFCDLCRPGHPDGVEFQGAAQKLRDLTRAELERGWRAAAAAGPPGRGQEGGGGGGGGEPEGGEADLLTPGEGRATSPSGGLSAGLPSPDGGQPPRRVFLTTTELRRRELAAAGALSHEEWLQRSEAAAEQRAARRKAAAAASRNATREATAQRCDRAVEMYELERCWTSRRV